MGHLKQMSPRLGALPSRLTTQRDEHGHSATAEPLRHLYWSARWKALRMRVFVRDSFTCQLPACGRLVGDTSKLVADHRTPHRGDLARFWDEDNVQTLCKPCHDSAKQSAERRPPP